MSATMALLVGVLFAAGTYLILRRDLVRVVWGLVLFGQAANLTVLTVGDIGPGRAPILDGAEGAARMDPLVQALVLTAIVIGLGTTAFALLLMYRVYEENRSLNARHISGWADLYGVARHGMAGATAAPAGDAGAGTTAAARPAATEARSDAAEATPDDEGGHAGGATTADDHGGDAGGAAVDDGEHAGRAADGDAPAPPSDRPDPDGEVAG